MDETNYSLGMANKTIFYLIVGTLVTGLVGCSREEKIDGSIFIVTKGSENFKLGLVSVSVFDQQQIEPYLAKTTADLEKTLKELKQQRERVSGEKNKTISASYALEQQFENANDLANKTFLKIGSDLTKRPEFTASDQKSLEEAIENYDSAAAEMKFFYKPKVEKLKRYKQEVAEMQTNWDSLKPTYLKQADEKDRLYQEWQKAKGESDNYAQSLAAVTERLDNWPAEQPRVYFNSPPTPLAVAKTDADGKFSLQLYKKGEFVLAAQAQRQVSGNTEKYFWLVRVRPDRKSVMQVMLSNDNLITANSPESAVRFPTP